MIKAATSPRCSHHTSTTSLLQQRNLRLHTTHWRQSTSSTAYPAKAKYQTYSFYKWRSTAKRRRSPFTKTNLSTKSHAPWMYNAHQRSLVPPARTKQFSKNMPYKHMKGAAHMNVITTSERRDLFRSVLGEMLFIATMTRPDICATVKQLASFSENPTEAHLQTLHTCARFLSSHRWHLILGGE